MSTTRDTHRQGEEIAKAPPGMVDEELQSVEVVSTGASQALTFAAMGLEDMADVSYRVLIGGETVARVTIDQSTKTVSGFTVLDGAALEVLAIFIHGKIASRKR